jgi:predicted transcriptional regulator
MTTGTIQYNDKWLHSYETLIFVGANVGAIPGALGSTNYALDGNGTGYYIQPKSAGQWQFIHIGLDLKDQAGNLYSLAGLIKVSIAPGHCYFDEFLTAQGAIDLYTPTSQYYLTDPSLLPAGDVVRILTSKVLYQSLGSTPHFPQPSRTEMISALPPPEPPQPHNLPHSIAFDATSKTGELDNVSSYAWSHTCGATANLLVLGHSSYTYGQVSGVTYNGTSLTKVREDEGSSYNITAIWFMCAPTTGSAKSVFVTLKNNAYCGVGGVVSYSGAAQSGQPDANNGATGNSSTATVNVTTIADNCWVFSVVNLFYTATCNNTARWNFADSQGLSEGGSDTNAPVTPAGSQTMSWVHDSIFWAISAASFAPIAITTYSISRTEGITTGESLAVGTRISRTEGINTGESLSDKTKITRTEGLTAGETLLLKSILSRTEGITLADTETLKAILSRAEGLTLTDSEALKTLISRSEGLTLTETLAEILHANLTRTESFSLSESVWFGLIYKLLISEGFSAGDALSITQKSFPSITEGFTAGESLSAIQKSFPSITEGLTIADMESLKTRISRTEGLTAGETLSETMHAALSKTEGLSIGETISELLTASISRNEGLSLTDSRTVQLILRISISEGLSLADAELLKTIIAHTEGLTVTDIETARMHAGINHNEGLSLADAELLKTIIAHTEGLSIGESISELLTANINRNEGLSLTDLKTVKAIISKVEGLSLTDSRTVQLILRISISEGLSLADTLKIITAYNIAITEGLSLTDAEYIIRALVIILGGSRTGQRNIGGSRLSDLDIGGSTGA